MRRPRPAEVAILGVTVALLTGFGLLADEVVEGDTLALDKAVIMMFRDPNAPAVPLGPSWLFEAARDITALGSISVLGIIVVALVLQLFLSGAWRTALFTLFAVLGGTVLSTGLKAVFGRARPDLTGAVEVFTASFPSGHATVSAVVYLTIAAILSERDPRLSLRVFYISTAALLTIMIGLSRVYLGVHYPTDVLAGWSLGSAWALLCYGVAYIMGIGRQPSEAPEK